MSFTAEEQAKKANFYKIKEGSFRLKTTQDDPKAVARPYTNPKTDEKGTAYERVFPALNGVISNIYFSEVILDDGTRLRSLNIKMGEDSQGAEAIATMPEDSRFATDFLSKLPNISLAHKVRLAPFDFQPEKGGRKVGISITQEVDKDYGEPQKVKNFFVAEAHEGNETRYRNINGMPEPTDEDKSDWPFYYKKVNKFLVQFAKTNILPKFQDSTRSTTQESTTAEENGAPDADDLKDSIPF